MCFYGDYFLLKKNPIEKKAIFLIGLFVFFTFPRVLEMPRVPRGQRQIE